MKKHTVNLHDLINWEQGQKVLFASSSKENKQLYFTLRGYYEVWNNGEKVLETTRPYTAVDKYNEL